MPYSNHHDACVSGLLYSLVYLCIILCIILWQNHKMTEIWNMVTRLFKHGYKQFFWWSDYGGLAFNNCRVMEISAYWKWLSCFFFYQLLMKSFWGRNIVISRIWLLTIIFHSFETLIELRYFGYYIVIWEWKFVAKFQS